MPIATKLKRFLDEHHIKYVSLVHSRAYTMQEVAESLHASGRHLAKTVVLTDGHENVMAVLPATRRVDVRALSHLLGGRDMRLASEAEFQQLFPDCEVGAMPPMGRLYGLRLFCDQSLSECRDIIFNAGTHVEAIKMSYADFVRLAEPEVADFAKTATSG
jgi:Ala-tRNA(Pro) deacylase